MTLDLFPETLSNQRDPLGPQSCVLRGYALPVVDVLLAELAEIEARAPFRHMVTPGGFTMSVALTNCGRLGWVTDLQGYRYSRADPVSGLAWPPMPAAYAKLARDAAASAGFSDFEPDGCLMNRYLPGARMSLHQDRNERNMAAPIVSVSLGMSATFLFGGMARQDKAVRVPLLHGDVVVWGGVDRLRFHGILPLKDEPHARLGSQRINMTFRLAG